RSVLRPYVRQRWRLAELTVNYRTPGPIMRAAADLLAAHGVTATELTSARTDGEPPTIERVSDGLIEAAVKLVATELAELGPGQLAVIVPAALTDQLTDRLPVRDQRLSVLTAGQAKGLEFDVVVLLEPAAIMAESAARVGHGAGDLYVAMTRCTQRLRVLHQQPLPAGLASLPS